eukprot:TRINITY_DN1852_c0_g1_i10.p1 TRINITY_DN1852_c0_g1~~TRINITY_DN1852_c0_g1_i10.p1  ORF type:complete len:656 (-),score=124.21 TRINITY_DN1852_c0_g1_i10:371-2338(-)
MCIRDRFMAVLTSGQTDHNIWIQSDQHSDKAYFQVRTPAGLSDFGISVKAVDTTVFVGAKNASTGQGVVTTWHLDVCQPRDCTRSIESYPSFQWIRGNDIVPPAEQTDHQDFGQGVAVDVDGSESFVDSATTLDTFCAAAVAEPSTSSVYVYACEPSADRPWSADAVTWLMEQKISGTPFSGFGSSVVTGSAGVLFIGAPQESAVYMYHRATSGYTLEQTLHPAPQHAPSPMKFGWSLDSTWRFGDSGAGLPMLIVGAPGSDSAELWTGVVDTTLVGNSNLSWTRVGVIPANRGNLNQKPGYSFGYSVALGASAENGVFFMIGAPTFNAHGDHPRYGTGTAMVGLVCGAGSFMQRGVDKGVWCQKCPDTTSDWTTNVWQAYSCPHHCPDHPVTQLPPGGYFSADCSISCTAGYAYNHDSNRCVTRGQETFGGASSSVGESPTILWVMTFVGVLPLIWCCWCLRRVLAIQRHRRLILTGGEVQRATAAPPSVNLEHFPIINKQATESMAIDVTDCSICLCEFEDDDKLRMLPCSHPFHVACIDRWLDGHTTCPLCMRSLIEIPAGPVGLQRPEPDIILLPQNPAPHEQEEAEEVEALPIEMPDGAQVHAEEECVEIQVLPSSGEYISVGQREEQGQEPPEPHSPYQPVATTHADLE